MRLPRLNDQIPPCGREAECFTPQAEEPPCFTHPDRLHQRFAAHELCLRALQHHLRAHRGPNGNDYCSTWDALETGLCQEDPAKAEEYFIWAEDRFGSLIEELDTPNMLTQRTGARFGKLMMPAYRAQYHKYELSGEEMATIYEGAIDILANLDITYHRNPDYYGGLKTEVIVTLLFLRLGVPIYWASHREEHGLENEFNHDSLIMLGSVKVPVQTKRKNGRGYNDTVAVLSLHYILEEVNKIVNRASRPLTYQSFANLLLREAAGEILSNRQRQQLDLASQIAYDEVQKKYRIITTGTEGDESDDDFQTAV